MAACGLLLAQSRQPIARRLDDAMRAKVMAAMAGLLVMAGTAIVLAWLASRAVRRYVRRISHLRLHRLGARSRGDDWAAKPLAPLDDPDRDEGDS
jgi:hypothetical protein